MSRSVVLLDRDGVINHDSDDYILSPDAWQPISGSLEAIADLTQAGLALFVVTNQSALHRGYMDGSVLAAIHTKMLRMVADWWIFFSVRIVLMSPVPAANPGRA